MTEFTCPKCRKNFIPAPMHVYKAGAKIYCSWTGYNHRNDGRSKGKAKVVEQYSKDGEYLNTFPSVTQATIYIDGVTRDMLSACKHNKPYKGYLWRYKNDLP